MADKKKKKVGNRDGAIWKFAMGLMVTIAIAGLGYYEWEKDRKPAVRYVDYQLLGTPGKTTLNFQTHYRNVGKTDATEITMESRFFTAEQFDPSLSKAESLPHSIGTVGAGLDMYDVGHSVSLTDSAAMVSPVIDNFRVWLHERVAYKDEDGNSQPVVDTCLVWDRKN
jgi:hypothetical protein